MLKMQVNKHCPRNERTGHDADEGVVSPEASVDHVVRHVLKCYCLLAAEGLCEADADICVRLWEEIIRKIKTNLLFGLNVGGDSTDRTSIETRGCYALA